MMELNVDGANDACVIASRHINATDAPHVLGRDQMANYKGSDGSRLLTYTLYLYRTSISIERSYELLVGPN
jgi:hypothetical protein